MTEARLPSEPHLSRVADDDDAFEPRSSSQAARQRFSPWPIVLAALAVAGLAAVYWWRTQAPPPAPGAPPVAATPPPATVPAEPAIRHPIGDVPKHAGLDEGAQTAIASLANSDAALRDALAGIPGAVALERFVHPQEVVRRFVATVDNLPRPTLASQISAVKPIEGGFAVAGPDGQRTLAGENAARYAPFVRFANTLDTKALVALYVRHYAWFQQAYVELGYPSGYFNDRLVEVIDHLLAAPDVKDPIALVQPRVLYQFAEPRLEALSVGQKMMIRMGSDNASQAKAKLREVRRALTGALPPAN